MKKILLAFFPFLLSCTQQNEKLQAIEGLALERLITFSITDQPGGDSKGLIR